MRLSASSWLAFNAETSMFWLDVMSSSSSNSAAATMTLFRGALEINSSTKKRCYSVLFCLSDRKASPSELVEEVPGDCRYFDVHYDP